MVASVRKRNNRDVQLDDNSLDPKSSGSNNNKRKKSFGNVASMCLKFLIVAVVLHWFQTPVSDEYLISSPQKTAAAAEAIEATATAKPTKAIPAMNHSALEVGDRQITPPATPSNSSLPQAATTVLSAKPRRKPKSNAAKCVRKIITKARSKERSKTIIANTTDGHHRRPILYLHPGPPKTATTTIQQLLTDHQKELKMDNIFFLGRTQPSEKYNCNFPHASYCIMFEQYKEMTAESNCTTVMMEQLDEYYSSGTDIVISDEVIGAMFATPRSEKNHERARGALDAFFNNIVRRNNWEIRLLIGYRPYFDVVKSQFSQVYSLRKKPSCKDKLASKKFKGKLSLMNWPRRGGGKRNGEHIPPLRDELFRKEWPTADELVDLFEPFVDRTQVFDITQNSQRGDLSVRFFCHVLEDARQTCSSRKLALNANNHTEVRKNVAVVLDYDRIATAAAERGLVKTTRQSRFDVTCKIEAFMGVSRDNNETNNSTTIGNLPLLCPTKNQTDKLYNLSIAQEMKLFPERKPHWETKELFETMMEQKKLCSVDTKKVLEAEEWKDFFSRLVEMKL